jgi:hypothetical protein
MKTPAAVWLALARCRPVRRQHAVCQTADRRDLPAGRWPDCSISAAAWAWPWLALWRDRGWQTSGLSGRTGSGSPGPSGFGGVLGPLFAGLGLWLEPAPARPRCCSIWKRCSPPSSPGSCFKEHAGPPHRRRHGPDRRRRRHPLLAGGRDRRHRSWSGRWPSWAPACAGPSTTT